MTDKDIIEYYSNKHIHSWKNIPDDHKEYLDNRFIDSESYKESVWRILYNIEKRPTCSICGNPVKFEGRKNNIFSMTCSTKCFKQLLTKPLTQEEIYYKSLSPKEKTKYTCLKKYGVYHQSKLNTNIFKTNNPNKNQLIKEKIKATRIDKYGQYMSPNNINILSSNDSKHKRTESFKNTMLHKYKNINYRNLTKHKQTCLEKYGVDSWFKTDEYKQLLIDKHDDIQFKINQTKQQNNTFNTSKPEQESFDLLKEKYPDVVSQYRSNLYPFSCDFYIPSLDLYIECNYHWTHGGHPYNEDNKDDRLIVENWKSKNTKFYNNAIDTWTIRDVNKRKTANENGLNYIEFWDIKNLISWLKK